MQYIAVLTANRSLRTEGTLDKREKVVKPENNLAPLAKGKLYKGLLHDIFDLNELTKVLTARVLVNQLISFLIGHHLKACYPYF